MTREEGKEFANALKNNYTIDFDKLPEFCDLVISALSKNKGEDRPKGYWIYLNGVWPYRWECNQCNSLSKLNFNFCPDCGADMREPKREKIRCNTCKNNDDEFSGECYECIKGIFDHYEAESEDKRV